MQGQRKGIEYKERIRDGRSKKAGGHILNKSSLMQERGMNYFKQDVKRQKAWKAVKEK
jgi:hypothetical protein